MLKDTVMLRPVGCLLESLIATDAVEEVESSERVCGRVEG
jgi:hypothetical protein